MKLRYERFRAHGHLLEKANPRRTAFRRPRREHDFQCFIRFTFNPIFKERVWGGRKLEQLYQKPLPPGVPIGESWEISDRPGDASVIANGPLAGKDLRWLMENHAAELLGARHAKAGRSRCW